MGVLYRKFLPNADNPNAYKLASMQYGHDPAFLERRANHRLIAIHGMQTNAAKYADVYSDVYLVLCPDFLIDN